MRAAALAPILLAVMSGVACGQVGVMGVGFFEGENAWSGAAAANENGSVVVGSSVGTGDQHAFRWTRAGGIVNLGGGSQSVADAVSGDGATAAGFSNAPLGVSTPVTWSGGVMQQLDLALVQSSANGASRDGSIVVGRTNPYSQTFASGFIWRRGQGSEVLAVESAIYAVSPDGQRITGYRRFGNAIHAFVEAPGGPVQDIGSLPGLADSSEGLAMTPTGDAVVGWSGALSTSAHAFRWTPGAGMQDLGMLTGTTSSYATGVSGDGTVAVGESFTGTGGSSDIKVAVVWPSGGGIVRVEDYLSALGVDVSGWVFETASGISTDGSTIVGTGRHNGRFEGWVARVSQCGSSDFDGDGDSATDADIEAFFACLAGNCCARCGSADFNGDGDVGTDADIEAFFRVLAGGSC